VKNSLRPYLWILVSSTAFAGMGTFTQFAGRACSWQMTAIVRCLIPLVVVLVWAKFDGVRLAIWGPPALWWRSLAGSFSLVGSFYVLNRLPLTDVYTISNLFPIWIALLSWPLLGAIPGPGVWLSVGSGVLGVVCIMRPRFASGDYAVLVVVAVSVFTALALMGLNRLSRLDPRAVVIHFSATALLFAIAALFVFGDRDAAEDFTSQHALQLLGAGVCATVGQYYLTKAFAAGDPAKVSVVGLTQIVFVLFLDVVLLGNPVEPEKLFGIPLIVGPTAWLMLRQARQVVASPPVEPATADCTR
jgi:drug/metabolite transporter (DMT)-like permease